VGTQRNQSPGATKSKPGRNKTQIHRNKIKTRRNKIQIRVSNVSNDLSRKTPPNSLARGRLEGQPARARRLTTALSPGASQHVGQDRAVGSSGRAGPR